MISVGRQPLHICQLELLHISPSVIWSEHGESIGNSDGERRLLFGEYLSGTRMCSIVHVIRSTAVRSRLVSTLNKFLYLFRRSSIPLDNLFVCRNATYCSRLTKKI